jgi:spore coat polysaccharide biosynthesis protein SpsF (cytidylyltransferase family)
MTRGTAVIVLQARLGSSRLPRKALRDLEGCTILRRCLERLATHDAAPLVLATTERAEDDALVREARALGVAVIRGSTEDVLGRFVMVARAFAPELIVRATADNPAVDIDAVPRVLEALHDGADYVLEQHLPVGAAVEGIRTAAMLDAAARTRSPYDREHVTPFIRTAGNGYRVRQPAAPGALCRSDLRFTIDTPFDLAYMSRVFAEAGALPRVPLADLIRAADRLASLEEVA